MKMQNANINFQLLNEILPTLKVSQYTIGYIGKKNIELIVEHCNKKIDVLERIKLRCEMASVALAMGQTQSEITQLIENLLSLKSDENMPTFPVLRDGVDAYERAEEMLFYISKEFETDLNNRCKTLSTVINPLVVDKWLPGYYSVFRLVLPNVTMYQENWPWMPNFGVENTKGIFWMSKSDFSQLIALIGEENAEIPDGDNRLTRFELWFMNTQSEFDVNEYKDIMRKEIVAGEDDMKSLLAKYFKKAKKIGDLNYVLDARIIAKKHGVELVETEVLA